MTSLLQNHTQDHTHQGRQANHARSFLSFSSFLRECDRGAVFYKEAGQGPVNLFGGKPSNESGKPSWTGIDTDSNLAGRPDFKPEVTP
jgi:hypothetical protein